MPRTRAFAPGSSSSRATFRRPVHGSYRLLRLDSPARGAGGASSEYKREAVRLTTQFGVTKSQVASDLGINANLLGRWCKDYLSNGNAAFPG